jgi:hypothetical protein
MADLDPAIPLKSTQPPTFAKSPAKYAEFAQHIELSSPENFFVSNLQHFEPRYTPPPRYLLEGIKTRTVGRGCEQTAGMVNERSPGKPNGQPTSSGQQPATKVYDNPYGTSTAPASAVPKFGEATLPQSPLARTDYNRPGVDSNLFIRPKPRQPEFTRVPQTSNHPHLHAAKQWVKGRLSRSSRSRLQLRMTLNMERYGLLRYLCRDLDQK